MIIIDIILTLTNFQLPIVIFVFTQLNHIIVSFSYISSNSTNILQGDLIKLMFIKKIKSIINTFIYICSIAIKNRRKAINKEGKKTSSSFYFLHCGIR